MVEGVFWGIFTVIMLTVAVMHPRIIYCILVVVCGISGIISCRSKRRKTAGKMCMDMVRNIIAILILCYLGQGLNVLFPYHAPDEAFKIEWVCLPGLLQGSGYHKLFFYADEAYLQEVYNTYEKYATVYTYDQYMWMNPDMKKSIEFPGKNEIEEQERKNVKVLTLYDNQDVNHLHNGGFYINQSKGYICFFAQ